MSNTNRPPLLRLATKPVRFAQKAGFEMSSLVDLLLVLLVLMSALALIVIFVRKSAVLRRIDVSAIQRDRNELVKGDLIAARLYRKFLTITQGVGTAIRPMSAAARRLYHRVLDRVEAMEREYRLRASLQQVTPSPETHTKVQALLGEGWEWLKTQELQQAEQKFIEVISLQPKNAEAFQGLGEVYLEKRDYHHAKESLKYALRLAPRDTALYLGLVEVYRRSGHLQKALEYARRAVAIEPNDPKCLHAMLTTSIAAGNQRLARTALSQLETANPENQKLEDYRNEVEAMQSR